MNRLDDFLDGLATLFYIALAFYFVRGVWRFLRDIYREAEDVGRRQQAWLQLQTPEYHRKLAEREATDRRWGRGAWVALAVILVITYICN